MLTPETCLFIRVDLKIQGLTNFRYRSNSYTMLCLPVRGVNSRALASRLSARTGGQQLYNYFLSALLNINLAHYKIFGSKVGKCGINCLNQSGSSFITNYTTFTNFSMKYHLMCKFYTDVGGIK